MNLENSKGKIFYGLHFYPGVCRYYPPDREPLTVLINENTIRDMNPSFAGRPVFVLHVDDVDQDLNELRKDADGWVVESFFNQADGKTWVKFILVSEKAFKAVQNGFKLSNAYIPNLSPNGGMWNGIPYQNEVTGGEFEHLALVKDPRYEESVIMTPEEFKAYNDQCVVELKKLSNSKGENKMKLNFFKRTKVEKLENSADLESLEIELPKSKKTVTVSKMVEEYDKFVNMSGYADGEHMVKVGENEMSVNELVKKHMDAVSELEKIRKENAETEQGGEPGKGADDDDPAAENSDEEVDEGMQEVGDRGGDKHLNDEEDGDADDKKKNKMKNEAEQKRIAREKALRLKNANLRSDEDEIAPRISLPADQVARGKSLYGSGK